MLVMMPDVHEGGSIELSHLRWMYEEGKGGFLASTELRVCRGDMVFVLRIKSKDTSSLVFL